jgi:hypothetical protein
MKTVARGPTLNADVGDVVEVPEKMGADLVRGGYAEPVKAQPEAAVEVPPEEAAVEAAPKRKGRSKK